MTAGNTHTADNADHYQRSAGAALDRVIEAIDRADRTVDGWWDDRLRGVAALDRLFYSASEVADHALLWHALGAAQALLRRDKRRGRQLSAALMGEAVVINGVVKTLFGRMRPVHGGDRPHALRIPITSSFPSSHASAAMVAAAMLSRGSRLRPAWYALALIVSLSRIHVRIHHASDVIAGIGIGAVLGSLARRLLR